MTATKFTYDDRKAKARIRRVREVMARTMVRLAFSATQLGVQHVIVNKLSGQSLNRVTGTAQRSIMASPQVEALDNGARGVFGSNLGYVRAHNDGFDGTVQVPEHERRRLRHRAKRTGRVLKRAVEDDPTSRITVRAHSRTMHVRARRFFNETMEEIRPVIRERMYRAVEAAARTGKVPTPAEFE